MPICCGILYIALRWLDVAIMSCTVFIFCSVVRFIQCWRGFHPFRLQYYYIYLIYDKGQCQQMLTEYGMPVLARLSEGPRKVTRTA